MNLTIPLNLILCEPQSITGIILLSVFLPFPLWMYGLFLLILDKVISRNSGCMLHYLFITSLRDAHHINWVDNHSRFLPIGLCFQSCSMVYLFNSKWAVYGEVCWILAFAVFTVVREVILFTQWDSAMLLFISHLCCVCFKVGYWMYDVYDVWL